MSDAEQAIRAATRLNSKMIYEVIRRDGEDELERPFASLVWSGIAAGILMGFSILGEALFRAYLPDAPWRYLVENLGYSFGFLLVIMGRMQLFTENTITTVLPLVAERSLAYVTATLRLWAIVLSANVAGALVAAVFIAHAGVFTGDVETAILDVARHAMGFPALEAMMRGIPAGILIAAIVWMMPSQNGGALFMIVIFTWLIAAGDFTHIIAGSVEMWVLLLHGELAVSAALFGFFLPVLAGNVIGGTAIFSLLAWGQVKAEVAPGDG